MTKNRITPVTVGIVLRTKDRPRLLRRAILSILQQTYDHWHLVVVNDGGDEASLDQVLRLAGNARNATQQIQIVHLKSSRGVGAAANAGLKLLNTDVLVLHDDDDSWPPDYLQASATAFEIQSEQVERLTLLAAPVVQVEELIDEAATGTIKRLSEQPFASTPPGGWLSLSDVLQHNRFPPIALMWDLPAVKQVGGFREDLPVLEDWDINRKLLLLGDGYQRDGAAARYHVRRSVAGSYANTITARRTEHLATRQRLLNEWLRDELAAGKFGPGAYTTLLNQAQDERLLSEAVLRELRQGGLLRDGKAFVRALRKLFRRGAQ